jgi:diaminopimelate decarboxylase
MATSFYLNLEAFGGVDAGFHNLVRPAMYGAHHDISVIGRASGGAELGAKMWVYWGGREGVAREDKHHK